MTLEETRIARHHLGDALVSLARGGPHGDDWIVVACADIGARSARAPTVDAAAADCAARLRAAGWTPTHARLEWRRNQLTLVVGSAPFPVATVVALHADAAVLIHPGMKPWEHRLNVAEALEVVAEWCAKNLPYHLPPFPGASDETHPCT